MKCNPHEIKEEVEKHLVRVFDGATEPIDVEDESTDHSYSRPVCSENVRSGDHGYTVPPSPGLPPSDGTVTVLPPKAAHVWVFLPEGAKNTQK